MLNLGTTKETLPKLLSYFFSGYRLKFQAGWFKRLLYLLLLVKCIYWLFFYDLLFGANSIITLKPYPINHISDLPFFLYSLDSATAAIYFIVFLIALCLLNLFVPKIYFISDFLIWLLLLNLHNRIYATLSGGDYLLNQFLFFNCFLSANPMAKENRAGQLKIVLHNFAVTGIIIQISLAYIIAAFTKLNDPDWLSGQAVSTISQVHHFSTFTPLHLPESLFVFLNYAVLFYQVLFPFVIWLPAIKKPFIATGILMHLYIAFVMGLVGFGIVMILAYIWFWPFKIRPEAL